MLLQTIDIKFKGTYDFFYLPIDFKNRCNVGYAFINFIDPKTIYEFCLTLNSKKWEKFNSEKVCELTYARIQGKEPLIEHFQNSSLMCEENTCRPIIFHSNGPDIGKEMPFPLGLNIKFLNAQKNPTSPIITTIPTITTTPTTTINNNSVINNSPNNVTKKVPNIITSNTVNKKK